MQTNTSNRTCRQADKCAHAQTGMNICCNKNKRNSRKQIAQAVLTNTQAQLRTYEKYGQIHANDKLLTQISKPYRIGDDYSLCGK
jgi:hypothetical protein